ncbi:glycosyltransferase family A protein [Flavobacterium paronense]|uniref:Glycosyltransferase family 2 protein n=1 Tax=Flavobacterium paronense TaxID=1392775 RepID=A0ABV5GFR7_9FLAO|nr:glycosyltransferase family A protein [Flavobacterium paronense]MDN3676610.1 glycosyltransferase family A protein [Flavobacterium paronense]
MPYFSIVIPVYNKEKFVAKTIESALSQTFTDYEIIIVNDGSTDQSEAKISTFKDNRIQYYSKKNEGVAITRNFGIEKATADYICFLDADDFWHPNFLETMHRFTSELPEQKVFAAAIEIETKNKCIPALYSISSKSKFEIVNFFDASQKECVLWTSSACIHRNVFENIGAFDTKIKHGEDTELWIRIGLQFPIVFIRKILACYVYDEKSVSRNSNYFFESYTFEKYALEEKQNLKLKKYMDLNRFSAVIKCNLNGDWKTSQEIYAEIDLKNLRWKKRLLLQLPSIMLKPLISLQRLIGNSVFR